ncbi:MAG: hypothetical protein QG670_2106 [Thermoproteota archaeon]|nr:hypothetical protein [Thermoproteota archaeon]
MGTEMRVSCSVCGRSFGTKSELDQHIAREHEIGKGKERSGGVMGSEQDITGGRSRVGREPMSREPEVKDSQEHEEDEEDTKE